MSTPQYSVYVRDVFPRGVALELSPMAADPAREVMSDDFGLQLILEARHRAGRTGRTGRSPDNEHAAVLDALYEVMMPRPLTLPMGDPRATSILSSGRLGGRRLLSAIRAAGDVRLSLERDYRAFCRAAHHYVYHASVVATSLSDVERGSDVTLALAVRLPWLVSSLAPGLSWESSAFSFAEYTTA